MKHILLYTLLFTSISSFAQSNVPMPCLSYEYAEKLFNEDPAYRAENAKIYTRKNTTDKTPGVKVIPVVFHVVYNTPAQNLHDSVLLNQLAILNRDFARLNADTSFMRSVYDGIVGDAEIEFQLAQFDPQGNPTTGITRTSTSITTFGSSAAWSGNFTLVDKVASTINGGEDAWDETKYFNIWIANTLFTHSSGPVYPAFYGLGTPPPGLPNWSNTTPSNVSFSGVFMHFEAVGSNNPNPAMYPDGSGGYYPYNIQGRTLVHEVGHYLGLRHVYGDQSNCTAGDGVADTPDANQHNGVTCNVGQNTCVDTHPTWGDMPDMIENYMEYSDESCQVSFTLGQISLMRGVLENERLDLVQGVPTAIAEKRTGNVKFYPNPANDFITVSLTTSSLMNSVIKIFDAQGKIVFNEVVFENQSEYKLDVNDLKNGLYVITINSDKGNSFAGSFLKQ